MARVGILARRPAILNELYVVFLSHSRKMVGYYLEFGYIYFLPHHFLFAFLFDVIKLRKRR
jgi:hypothetical protein